MFMMVYGRYIELVNEVNEPTYNYGGTTLHNCCFSSIYDARGPHLEVQTANNTEL